MTKAETFIRDFEEVENNTISLEEMKKDYGDWIRTVKESSFKLSDTDTAPVERIRWAAAILDLAGWVTNMALFMEREEAADKPGETWMVNMPSGGIASRWKNCAG